MSDIKALLQYMEEHKTIVQIGFKEGESWFVSQKMNPFSLADTYTIAADIIIANAKDDDVDDIVAFPVVFLYRHATELYLKQILNQITGADCKGHNIKDLYAKLQENLSNLEKQKGISDLLPDKATFFSIHEFFSISPKSDEFRYPDSELLSQGQGMCCINFKNAKYHADNVSKYFKNLEDRLVNLGFVKKYGFEKLKAS